VKESEFWALAEAEFGRVYARSLASDLALRPLGDLTVVVALADGVEPGRVWTALCDAMDVPPDRRGGPVPAARRQRPGGR
jgi:Protein of unknown function (DUF3046)